MHVISKHLPNYSFYYTRLQITYGPCNLIGSHRWDLFTNRAIYARKRIFP